MGFEWETPTARLLLAAAVLAGGATPQSEVTPLLPADGLVDKQFGESVAVSGDTVIVGAWGTVSSAGAVHVYERDASGWCEIVQLFASDSAPGDRFGESVAITGSLAAVSSQTAAYVLERSDAWAVTAKLTPDDAPNTFGDAIAVDGETIVVGSTSATNGAGVAGGAVYVYERTGTTWSQTAKVFASDGAFGDRFGYSVSLHCGTLAVGAPDANPPGELGAAYVFERIDGSWIETVKLAAGVSGNNQFGASVAVFEDVLVVGAPGEDDPFVFTGATRVFERAGRGWAPITKLLNPAPGLNDWFGGSVGVSGTRIVVGALADDYHFLDSGAAFLFERSDSGWTLQQQLLPGGLGPDDGFGYAVDIDGGRAVVGAPGLDFASLDPEVAYVFEGLADAPTWTDLGSALPGALGVPLLTGEGALVSCEPVSLVLENALPSAAAFLVVGAQASNAPLLGGTLVPSPDVVVPALIVDDEGCLVLGGLWPPGIGPGVGVFIQEWVADPSGPSGFTASNGLLAVTP